MAIGSGRIGMSRNKDMNEKIRSEYVSLVNEDGNGCEVVRTEDALEKARQMNLDLVLVGNLKDDAPVAKIVDHGKLKFMKAKAKKAQKKASVKTKTKEIKLRPNIQDHDKQVKLRHGIRFLSQGHNLKVTVTFSGREISHNEMGWNLISSIKGSLIPEHGKISSPANLDGRNISILIEPN